MLCGFGAKAQPRLQGMLRPHRQVVLHLPNLTGNKPKMEQKRSQVELDCMDCRHSEWRPCKWFTTSAELKEKARCLAVFFRQGVNLLRGCKLTRIFAFFERHWRIVKTL